MSQSLQINNCTNTVARCYLRRSNTSCPQLSCWIGFQIVGTRCPRLWYQCPLYESGLAANGCFHPTLGRLLEGTVLPNWRQQTYKCDLHRWWRFLFQCCCTVGTRSHRSGHETICPIRNDVVFLAKRLLILCSVQRVV